MSKFVKAYEKSFDLLALKGLIFLYFLLTDLEIYFLMDKIFYFTGGY